MDKKTWFAVVLILLIGLMADRDPLFWKEFSLTLGGAICLAIVLWHKRGPYKALAALAIIAAYHMAKPEGMQFWSTGTIFYIGCFLGLAYFCRQYVLDTHIKWAICLCGIGQAGYALLQIFYDPLFTLMEGYGPEFRIIGTLGNKQYLLMFLFAAMPVYFSQAVSAGLRKIGLVMVALALIAGWCITKEIGYCEAGAAIAGLVWLIRRGHKKLSFGLFVLACVAVAVIFGYEPKRHFVDPGPGGGPGYYVFDNDYEKFFDNISGGIVSRIDNWSIAWGIVKSRPYLGYGLGSFKMFGAAKNVSLGQAHNEYLQMWAELGIMGLVGSLLLFLFILWKCTYTRDPAYYFSVLMLGLFSFAQFPFHLSPMVIFLLRGKK